MLYPPEKVTRSLIKQSVIEVVEPVRTWLNFTSPRALAALSDADATPLLSPESSMALLTIGDDPAAADLMITLGVSCAREGARVLFLSSSMSRDDFCSRVFNICATRSQTANTPERPSLASLNLLDSLSIYYQHLPFEYYRLEANDLTCTLDHYDIDLLVVEGANAQKLDTCKEAATAVRIPIVFNQAGQLEDRRVSLGEMRTLPDHVLLMDRSITELEAERDDRPYYGVRECRLMIPSALERDMVIPFLGTFTLAYSENDHRISDYIDGYDGHLLLSEIEGLDLGPESYCIIEPDHYGRKLELLYGD